MAPSSKMFPLPMGEPGKWLELAQEQQTDNLQTGMALVTCREPVAMMSLQQAFLQRTMKRWGLAGLQPPAAAKPAPAPAPVKPAPKPAPVAKVEPKVAPAPVPKAEPAPAPKPPVQLVATAAKPDDLTVIKGIGPKFAATLAEHGITTFAKLADLSEKEIEDLEAKLGFSGRFARENWVEQARALVAH